MSNSTDSPVLETTSTTAILQNDTAASLTKTQKRKQKKQLNEELRQRAQMIAEEQKLFFKSSVAFSKSSESASSSMKTSSVIAASEPDDSVDASNNASPQSDNGSSDPSTGFKPIPIDDDLPSRTKKIRKLQRQQNRQKNLLNLGGGIVESEKPSSFRKQPPSKNRRQLTKHDKVKHNSVNPAANLILKHQNDSPALNAAAQRITEQQNMHKARNTKPKGNTSSRMQSGPSPMHLEQHFLAKREKLAWDILLTSLDTVVQREASDDMSERCVTIASDSDSEDVPELVTHLDGGNMSNFIANSDDMNAPDFAVHSTTVVDEDVVMHSGSSSMDSNLHEDGALNASSDVEDQFDDDRISEDWITSDDTISPDEDPTPAGTVTPDHIAAHDASNLSEIAIPNAVPIPPDCTFPGEPNSLQCTFKVTSNVFEDVSHTPPDDAPTTSIKSSLELPINKLPEPESAPSWVAGLLSLPNAAQYPSALSLDRELALIAMHVTPLSLSESKKASKTETITKKAPSETSTPSKTSVQFSSIKSTTAIEPAGIMTPFNNESTSANEYVVHNLYEQSLSAKEKPPVEAAVDICGFVASMLSRPNGSGQTAAARKLHETLVRLHVPALDFSLAEIKKLKSSSKNSTDHIATLEDEVAVLRPDSDPVSNAKNMEISILISPFGNPKFLDISRRSSPTSKPLNSSKTPSRRSSVRSDDLTSNDLEQKFYKARNTYLGIASLEDFLILLDFDENTGNTTKTAICETFTSLSAEEADIIRGQRLTRLHHTDLPTAYAQRRIKLGATTLSAFLQDIVFGVEDMTHVAEVIGSFRNAAQHDVQPSSKLAAAFSLESLSSVGPSPVSYPLPSFRLGSGSLSLQPPPSRPEFHLV